MGINVAPPGNALNNATPTPVNLSDASSIVNYAKGHGFTGQDAFSAVQANPQDQTAVNAYVTQLFTLAESDAHGTGQDLDLQSLEQAATAALLGAGVQQGTIDIAEHQAAVATGLAPNAGSGSGG